MSRSPSITSIGSNTATPATTYSLFSEDAQSPCKKRQYLAQRDFSELRLKGVLGIGAYSKVYSATLKGGERVAVKISSTKQREYLIEREHGALARLQTSLFPSHVVPTYGTTSVSVSTSATPLQGLVLPMFDTDLNNYISQMDCGDISCLHIGSMHWWSLAQSLFQALRLLQFEKMVHCDIKSSNVLFNLNDTQSFMLADLASFIDAESPSSVEYESTLRFTDPWLLQLPKPKPTYATDLYSVGLVLLHAATGRVPYHGIEANQQLINSIRNNKCLDVLDSCSLSTLRANPRAFDLLSSILIRRLTLEEICARNLDKPYTSVN